MSWGCTLGVEGLPEVCRALGESPGPTNKLEAGILSNSHSGSTTCVCSSKGGLCWDGKSHSSLPVRHRTRTSAQFHQQSSLNQCSRIPTTLRFRMTLCRQVCFTFQSTHFQPCDTQGRRPFQSLVDFIKKAAGAVAFPPPSVLLCSRVDETHK